MCWIEVPNHAVLKEVQARIDVDPAAVVIVESSRGRTRAWALLATAFIVGVAVGWLWRF